jgi:hypothetical protein
MKSLKKTTAWKWFALYIKERDNWTCQTCGRKGKGQFMNAGHFIQAFGHNAVFFDERNVFAQCINCNIWGAGKPAILREVIIKRYGKKAEEELWKKAREVKQFTKVELDEIAKIYKKKYEELLKQKGRENK